MKFLFGLLLFSCAISASSEERQKIPVPKPFLECTTDAECEMTVELCGCCNYIAMNKRSVRKYSALERFCKEPAPPCKCMDPGKTPRCVKKLCQLIPQK